MNDAMKQGVEYRDIVGFPGYRVGNDGTVWNSWINCVKGRLRTNRWKQLKHGVRKARSPGRRYHYVNLTPPGGKYKTFRVHRLVLEAFVGPCPAGHECRHLDGDPSNNALDNLAWGTPAENKADNRRLGRYLAAEESPRAKLTNSAVIEIRARYASGKVRMVDLASVYHVSLPTISMIVNRRTWTTI